MNCMDHIICLFNAVKLLAVRLCILLIIAKLYVYYYSPDNMLAVNVNLRSLLSTPQTSA